MAQSGPREPLTWAITDRHGTAIRLWRICRSPRARSRGAIDPRCAACPRVVPQHVAFRHDTDAFSPRFERAEPRRPECVDGLAALLRPGARPVLRVVRRDAQRGGHPAAPF